MAILTPETHAPRRVFDANGVELHYVTWCDTETGEAVHVVDDAFVMTDVTVNDAGELVVRTEWRQHRAPLRVEWTT